MKDDIETANYLVDKGKIIVIAVTAILKVLEGQQVVVVTPNDYPNNRDY